MAAYAIATDLAAWLGVSAPSDSVRLLANASRAVDTFLIGAIYQTDVNQMPTDAVVIQALNDATCAQVEFWLATHDELGEQDLDFKRQAPDGGAILERTPSRRPRLCPRSREILQLAFLGPSKPGLSLWG